MSSRTREINKITMAIIRISVKLMLLALLILLLYEAVIRGYAFGHAVFYAEAVEAAPGHDITVVVKDGEDVSQAEASVKETAQKVDWQTQKAEQARIRKIENALKKAEEKIAELEEKIASIDAECAKPEVAVNSAKLGELTKQQSEYQEELEKQYEVWEELSMELDA